MEEDTNSPLRFLPANLRAAAAKLPAGEAHTVLVLPDEGEGHNAGLLKVAAICFKMGVPFETTVAHLEEIYARDRIDYRTAPRRAALRIWEGEGELVEKEEGDSLPDVQEELLLRFRRTPPSGLLEASPHKPKVRPVKIIETLFKPDEIVNIQMGKVEAGTLCKVSNLAASYGEEIHAYKFLNPSVFKKLEGVPAPTADDPDKISTRCNANVKARPFMVLEMDSKDDASIERFTTFALELARYAPLVMALETGNKSIHFWFNCREASKADVSAIFTLACLHGADKQMGVHSQIARMPNVSASGEGRGAQRVVYYDPDGTAFPNGLKWSVKGFEEFIARARQLDFFYHGSNSKYYAQSNSEAWISLGRTSLTNQLVKRGFRENRMEGEALSPVEDIISSIEMDKSIEAALNGASGRHAGYYEENGFRFLVLKSPNFIKPRKSDWSTIRGFLTHMLDHTPDQLEVYLGWLSSSAKDLRNGGRRRAIFSPAQKVYFCGEPNSGKSLNLKFILPATFGGRSADGDELFSEKGASFNSDLFQSELIYLDDTEVLLTDHKSRAKYGERIKSFTVGAGGNYHQKFGDKIPIAPWWRFVRMMNEERTTLDTLPPLDEGIVDKMIILRCRSMKGGAIDTTKPGWFEPVKAAIEAELPAYLHYLLEEHVIPAHIADPEKRYAVKSYLNPEIMELLREDSPESYLVQKIDTEAAARMFRNAFEDDTTPHFWEGTANELYSILLEVGTRNSQDRFRKTCPSPKVLASQLRATRKEKGNVRFRYSGNEEDKLKPIKRNGFFYWRISPEGMAGGAVEADDCL